MQTNDIELYLYINTSLNNFGYSKRAGLLLLLKLISLQTKDEIRAKIANPP